MRRIDPNPAPNQYTLPPIIGSKQPNKPAAPAYVMTSRTEVLYSDQKCLLLIQYLYFFYISEVTLIFYTCHIGRKYTKSYSYVYEFCQSFMEITVFFFKGGVESYTSYEVYSTKCCLCCSTLQLPVEIKILDPELLLNGSV